MPTEPKPTNIPNGRMSNRRLEIQSTRIRIFDVQAFRTALDEDANEFFGPEVAAMPSRTTEDEVWARLMRKIIADPMNGYRRTLIGSAAMARRLVQATATMPHFAAVTGIIERAVRTSARRGTPVRFPPIVMLAEPGVGKSYFARRVAAALSTAAVPIALNATSDRGQLGGLSSAWRGAKLGKFARAVIFECETASPLFLLDEIDKTTNISGENVASILLSALEPENAAVFTDEYIDLPVRLDQALWLASANSLDTIPPALLSRLLVVEVPLPSREQSRVIIRSLAAATVACPLERAAIDLLLEMNVRTARQAIEIAHPFCVCDGRAAISANDMRKALTLIRATTRRRPIGFTR